jgi:hypothetical protein
MRLMIKLEKTTNHIMFGVKIDIETDLTHKSNLGKRRHEG